MNTLVNPNHSTDVANTNPQRDYILLDASSSMSTRWWESLEAIDSYVSTMIAKQVPTKVTVATFTSGRDEQGRKALRYDVARDCSLADWVPCVSQSPDMWAGMTPLYDAINRMMRILRDEDPSRCSIVNVTDGDENDSFTSAEQARSLLDWARARGWQITFLGCDFNNSHQARLLGASDANAVGTSAARLKDATAALANKRANHARFGTPMHYTDAERARFGGYLSAK